MLSLAGVGLRVDGAGLWVATLYENLQAEACATLGDLGFLIHSRNLGGIMTLTPAPPASPVTPAPAAAGTLSKQTVGLYVQIGGAGAFIVGLVLSLHHYGAGICFIAGAAAFFVGKKMRG